MNEVFGSEILVNFFIPVVGSLLALDLVFTPFGTPLGYFHMHLSAGMIHFSVPLIILLVPSGFFSCDMTLSI